MKKKIFIGIGIVILLLIWSGISVYPDWLWFENLNFSSVFQTMLIARFGFGFAIWLGLIVITIINLYVARRFNPVPEQSEETRLDGFLSQTGLSYRALNTLLLAFIALASFVIASKGSAEWDTLLRFFYGEPFGKTDPIFNKDIGFYVFSLPFYILIRKGILISFLFAGLVSIGWYFKEGTLQIIDDISKGEGGVVSLPKFNITQNAKKHLFFLAGAILILIAWGYYLKIYGVLYSTQGPAFGASYTDVNIKILVFKLLAIISIGLALVLFINAVKLKKKLAWISGGIWVVAIMLLGTGLPILVQKIVVKPNELAKESPYIIHNIKATREAYNLNKIKEVNFDVDDKLTSDDLKKHNATIQNIRIWDKRPLLQTYRQIQAIRLYYDFNDVDVDRYFIDGQYKQIMLSAREMVVSQLPAKANTWVNRHLTYTHGYGLAASPVNEITVEGLPRLLIKDLPPSSEIGTEIMRPEIYYGEQTNDYVLVNTKTKEFDYPKGDKNVYTTYQGKGGILIKSFMRRILFSFEFMDPQIFFTNYLTSDSKIMYNRRINKRAALLAPFLDYDRDPYLVLSEGRLFWILDAYTTSNMYPYSRPTYGKFNKAVNYIRNSVKITIDAYNGEVTFYLMDDKDPIAKTYSTIFPELFKPFSKMPEAFKKHIRYPKDLFEIQAGAYTTYHMVDPQVFYNQEDLWQIPDELYGESRQKMESYYIILKLPGEEKEEFLLMLPFTPSEKDNMIGWLSARSDLPNYGNLLAYKLPKEKLVYGPMQIEARVDQQTEISKELTLWGQGGSRVIRGNLLAIPLSNSFIYVEPVYLEAQQEAGRTASASPPGSASLEKPQRRQAIVPQKKRSRNAALPELKRVIVAFGNKVIMEDTLDRALAAIVEHTNATVESPSPVNVLQAQEPSRLVAQALKHYKKAKGCLREGNWAQYGRELDELEKILKKMAEEGN